MFGANRRKPLTQALGVWAEHNRTCKIGTKMTASDHPLIVPDLLKKVCPCLRQGLRRQDDICALAISRRMPQRSFGHRVWSQRTSRHTMRGLLRGLPGDIRLKQEDS